MVDQEEIHRKAASDDVEERRWAVGQLSDNFADLPDKELAWKDMIRLTQDDWLVRSGVEGALDPAFQQVPDKKQAWNDLILMTESEVSYVQLRAAYALGSAFQYVRDKEEAWRDLHRLAGDEDINMRYGAAVALGRAFSHIPDKKQAWIDLILMAEDEDLSVRFRAADVLGSVFQYVSEKDEAWDDLIRLTNDEDSVVRMSVAVALGSAFQYVSEKDEAWDDLIRMTKDEDSVVRLRAVYALGSAFQHVPDREYAWRDLHRLTEDEDGLVRLGAASAVGAAFQHISDKSEAWDDLQRLTADEDHDLRASANHALGRASIFKATEAEDEEDFKSELKNAIEFFERSSSEATYSNPSSFCLPFYRSFYSLTFEKAGAEGEVKRYLAEAKSASEGSENKETLLEAVENLANALSEAHKVTDFDAMKSDLNSYRRYCDRAACLIGDAAEAAPGAARVLLRGLPIIGERIREIQEKAEALCRETRGTGTPYEPLGTEVHKWARDLSDRGYLQDEKDVPRIRDLLGKLCNLIPEDEQDYPCKIVEEIREEREPEYNLSDVVTALSYLVPSIKSQLQNAAKLTTDEMRSDEQPSQKTGHSTTVFAGEGSNVTVTQTETGSGDVAVTNDAKATKESQPGEHPTDHRKKTAIEIIAAFAVSVLAAILSPRYLEDLTPTASTVIAFIAFIILLMIILTRNRDKLS